MSCNELWSDKLHFEVVKNAKLAEVVRFIDYE